MIGEASFYGLYVPVADAAVRRVTARRAMGWSTALLGAHRLLSLGVAPGAVRHRALRAAAVRRQPRRLPVAIDIEIHRCHSDLFARRPRGPCASLRSSRHAGRRRRRRSGAGLTAVGSLRARAVDARRPRARQRRADRAGRFRPRHRGAGARTTSPSPPARCCSRSTARATRWRCGRPSRPLVAAKVALTQAQRENARNIDLGNLISQELREQTSTRVEAARGQPRAGRGVARRRASLNLERAQVRAPTDGPRHESRHAHRQLRAGRPRRRSRSWMRSRFTSRATSRRPSCRASTWATACA